MSSERVNQGHFIQLKNELENSSDCKVGDNPKPRVLLAKNDASLLSLLLTAKAANKKVGFYYRTGSPIPKPNGHGLSDCEFVNAWLESD
ncbi:hypothetical protein [Vibrio mediterranei]|uniref:hypothetical protein n=1 Tax=Vibrio mediterranei TaxID=689 RepID=UPI00148C9FC9|nr:hypothetical protein [Vibrio mediterranei]NOH29409.1 hypothetical protein [Vibrio mediterranei]